MSKTARENSTWTVSPHAKQRAWERYEVVFSLQKWADFCSTMQNGKCSIRLGCDASGSCRFACYFQGTWFLVGCSLHGKGGTVSTFLPAEALTDADKNILLSNDRYGRFGNDVWNIMNQRLSRQIVSGKRTILPDVEISPEELPADFDQGGKLLEKEIGGIPNHK